MFKFKKNLKFIKRSSNIENRSQLILRLDRNEKISFLNKKQKNNFIKYLGNIELNLYPNFETTYKKLSKFLKLDRRKILITEGVSGAIKNILDSIDLKQNTEIIVPSPSFALYNIYSKIYGLKTKRYTYDKKFNLKIEDIFNLISKNTSIVFFTFPNIPVEGNINLTFIKTLAKFLQKRKILFVIDEVYYPFNKHSAINLSKKFNNMIIMRSFSKAFGLAGARIGYLVADKKKIEILSNTKGGYETNALSASAVNFVLDNIKLTKKYVKDVEKGFMFLKRELQKLNINYYGGSQSNFIFVNFKNHKLAKNIYKKLLKNKISVRFGYPKPFNKGILLTGCPLNEMKKFLRIFKKIYK